MESFSSFSSSAYTIYTSENHFKTTVQQIFCLSSLKINGTTIKSRTKSFRNLNVKAFKTNKLKKKKKKTFKRQSIHA